MEHGSMIMIELKTMCIILYTLSLSILNDHHMCFAACPQYTLRVSNVLPYIMLENLDQNPLNSF
jgi:hypothetical protein